MKETNGNGEPKSPPKIQVKNVKHVFTPAEQIGLGSGLARALANLRGIEAEFDQVKASFKARTAEGDARVDRMTTDIQNGFDMRDTRCVVVFRPQERKKLFIPERVFEDFGEEAEPALIEDMTPGDFQAELIQAESKFDHREEIQILSQVNNDGGVLVVGQLAGKWFSALRVKVGNHSIEERLDSEQPCSKKRYDAVHRAAKRLKEWLVEKFGKDLAGGFEEPMDNAVEAQKERVE